MCFKLVTLFIIFAYMNSDRLAHDNMCWCPFYDDDGALCFSNICFRLLAKTITHQGPFSSRITWSLADGVCPVVIKMQMLFCRFHFMDLSSMLAWRVEVIKTSRTPTKMGLAVKLVFSATVSKVKNEHQLLKQHRQEVPEELKVYTVYIIFTTPGQPGSFQNCY